MCLQEVHGEQAEIESYLERHMPKMHAFVSAGCNRRTGGNVILVAHDIGARREDYTHQVFAGGRVQRLAAARDGNQAVVWNVHS